MVRNKESTSRAIVRRRGKLACKTFPLKTHANEWSLEAERMIDLDDEPATKPIKNPKTFAPFVDLHVADLHDAGKPIKPTSTLQPIPFAAQLGRNPPVVPGQPFKQPSHFSPSAIHREAVLAA